MKSLFLISFFLLSSLFANDGVVVDLRNPIYEDGVLTTTEGGVLQAPDLRIQAQKITYTKKTCGELSIVTVACEGNLLIDYQQFVLVGDYFYFDFNANTGFLINGRTAAPPWLIGGKEIHFMANQSLIMIDGFLTASEGEIKNLSLFSPHIVLTKEGILKAAHINLRVNEVPVFWFPQIQLNLNKVGESPFGFEFGWRGFLKSYASVLYRFLSWKEFVAIARVDGFLGHGVGFGIETEFCPSWRPTKLFTRSYYAFDIALNNPKRRDRYRLQGSYCDKFFTNFTIEGKYDLVSDADMATEYTPNDFALKTANRTEVQLRTCSSSWIATLYARARVNKFQSVPQQLPTLSLNIHPFEIPHTGIIFENAAQASYLNYVFSEDVVKAQNFSSARLAISPFLYRPFFVGPLTIKPEAGFTGIAYSNHKIVGVGQFNVTLESALSKSHTCFKHVIEPYLNYSCLTHPTLAPDDHHIFTINDGLNRLNLMRFGARNSVFTKGTCGIVRTLWIDLWANAFFDTKTVPEVIPKGYMNLEWLPTPRMFLGIESAWNFRNKTLDFFYSRAQWTFNENLAVSLEYRHRSPFAWRKADFYNFILESTRSQEELLRSPLSQKCDTFLFRIFSRPTPDWTMNFDLRHGWNRDKTRKKDRPPQKNFLEYKLALSRVVFEHWIFTVTCEKREADDHRISASLVMSPGPP